MSDHEKLGDIERALHDLYAQVHGITMQNQKNAKWDMLHHASGMVYQALSAVRLARAEVRRLEREREEVQV